MWLYIPREYCPSSPESLDSISEFGLFFQNQELCVSLSGKPTQRPYSWRGWKTRPWIKLLSGVTLQPSTAASGMELWIQSQWASHASRLVVQANEQELRKGHDQDSSLKPAELFAKYHPSGIFLSKTSQDSFLTDSCQSYSANFPKWGSMHSGECFQQKMWAAPILEKESLSWPTATRQDFKRRGPNSKQQGLPEEVNNWPTPRSGNPGSRPNKKGGKILNEEAQIWGTPTVDAISDRKNKYAQGGTPIAMQASSWPTPRKVDTEDGNENNVEYSNGHFSEIRKSTQVRYGAKLCNAAASWPTPTRRIHKGGVSKESLIRKDGKCRNDMLDTAVLHTGPSAPVKQNNGSDSSKSAQTSPQPLKNWETPKVQMGEDCPSERRRNSPNLKSQSAQMATRKKRLNPNFVEWLMGVPIGWSLPIPIDQNVFKRWETESCHLLRLLHSASYGNE